MEMVCLTLRLILLVLSGVGGVEAQFFNSRARWIQVFASDVTVSAFNHSLPDVDTRLSCAQSCTLEAGCKSFGFSAISGTCLLYDHLVEYTTRGTAAPETRYYWLLSPRCPTELGYTLEGGVCFKWMRMHDHDDPSPIGPAGVCSQDGGHLFIADTAEKRNILRTPVPVWVGAKCMDKEGDWRWVNGKPVLLDRDVVPFLPVCSSSHDCLIFEFHRFRRWPCYYYTVLTHYEAACEIPM